MERVVNDGARVVEGRSETIAILGAGVMGETLLSGLLRAGRCASDVVITERRADRAAELARTYGVKVLDNPEAAADGGHHRARGQAAGHRRAAHGDPGPRRGPARWWSASPPGSPRRSWSSACRRGSRWSG